MRRSCSLFLWIALAVVQAPANAAEEAEARTIEVMPGDSLYAIVRQYFPDNSSAWSLISHDIVRLNPQAFRDGDPGSLRVGETLRLPKVAGAVPPPRAPMRVPPEAASDSDAPQHGNASPDDDSAVAVQAPAAQPVEHIVIGEIVDAPGRPLGIDRGQRERTLGTGSKVFLGDELVAGEPGPLRMMMNDGAELLLRPFSRIAIDEYTFIETQPEASRSTIKLLAGGLRTITGLIGRRNPDGFRVQTEAGIIGVRGTDFGVRVCTSGGCTIGESMVLGPGVYSGVLDGEIVLANEAATVAVGRGEFMHTRAMDAAHEPAPEAAAVVFSTSELAVLEPATGDPMNFFEWLRYWLGGSD